MRAASVPVDGECSGPGRDGSIRPFVNYEKQNLGQMVLGMSNAEIVTKLFLAESTVKSHLSSAFTKLGVTSRNEAADLILNPTAGVGLGILTIPSEKISTVR
jgi:ATP/maltotriose-dependent transcriptional regulator MalT